MYLQNNNEKKIALSGIVQEAYSHETTEPRAKYLKGIIDKAIERTGSVGGTINDVEFTLQSNGDIHPFGARPVFSNMFMSPELSDIKIAKSCK